MFNQGEKVKSDVTVVVAQGKIFPTLNSDQCWYQSSKKIKSIKLDFENHVFLFFLMVHDHFSGCGIFNFELVYNILFPADVWPTLHVHLVWPRATNILISKYFDNNKYLQQIFSFQPMPDQFFVSIWFDPLQGSNLCPNKSPLQRQNWLHVSIIIIYHVQDHPVSSNQKPIHHHGDTIRWGFWMFDTNWGNLTRTIVSCNFLRDNSDEGPFCDEEESCQKLSCEYQCRFNSMINWWWNLGSWIYTVPYKNNNKPNQCQDDMEGSSMLLSTWPKAGREKLRRYQWVRKQCLRSDLPGLSPLYTFYIFYTSLCIRYMSYKFDTRLSHIWLTSHTYDSHLTCLWILCCRTLWVASLALVFLGIKLIFLHHHHHHHHDPRHHE